MPINFYGYYVNLITFTNLKCHLRLLGSGRRKWTGYQGGERIPDHPWLGQNFICLFLENIIKMSLYIIDNDHNKNSKIA